MQLSFVVGFCLHPPQKDHAVHRNKMTTTQVRKKMQFIAEIDRDVQHLPPQVRKKMQFIAEIDRDVQRKFLELDQKLAIKKEELRSLARARGNEADFVFARNAIVEETAQRAERTLIQEKILRTAVPHPVEFTGASDLPEWIQKCIW